MSWWWIEILSLLLLVWACRLRTDKYDGDNEYSKAMKAEEIPTELAKQLREK